MLGDQAHHCGRLAQSTYLGGALIAGIPGLSPTGEAFAANCNSRGGLAYLGNTQGATRSVWLSGTSAGSFSLEAAQGNQTVDTWNKSKRGLHLSLSPVVSSGNGGTHKLYDTSAGKPCLLDTQNQKRGPRPDITWPQGLPDVGPQRVFPDFSLPDGRPDVGPQPVFPDFSLPDGRPDVGPQPVFPGFAPPTPTPARGGRVTAARTPQTCIDPRSVDTNQRRDLPICPELVPEEAAAQGSAQSPAVPLTPGRDLPAPSLWNFWWDARFADISDERYERDSDTLARSLDMGLDRRITDLVLGMSFSLEDSSTDAFSGSLDIDTEGFSFGPYLAYRLSKHWAVDASLTYGRYNNDVDLSVLSGDYDSERFAGEVSLHGSGPISSAQRHPSPFHTSTAMVTISRAIFSIFR
ncbi:autotransporter outer membrane beta-barrel domain-containing protein [Sinorhizobium meliloti]|uniref:autotransporter outer membrane beta-barrel domain-containing protein n=1 Tax=Rhizobium meliloti TaxID=382 RepID=UPI0023523DAE|nr:autotransporter domain-containing protein [Sinorhizobium meliloti]